MSWSKPGKNPRGNSKRGSSLLHKLKLVRDMPFRLCSTTKSYSLTCAFQKFQQFMSSFWRITRTPSRSILIVWEVVEQIWFWWIRISMNFLVVDGWFIKNQFHPISNSFKAPALAALVLFAPIGHGSDIQLPTAGKQLPKGQRNPAVAWGTTGNGNSETETPPFSMPKPWQNHAKTFNLLSFKRKDGKMINWLSFQMTNDTNAGWFQNVTAWQAQHQAWSSSQLLSVCQSDQLWSSDAMTKAIAAFACTKECRLWRIKPSNSRLKVGHRVCRHKDV